MRSKYFLSIALCGLLLTVVSCNTRSRVKSVFVDPARGVYNYALPGDTLEFQALGPNASDFYVIFDEPSPCAEMYLKVTKDKPGACKVQARSGSFHYRLSYFPPTSDRKPQPCPGCQYLVPCPECIIVIIPHPGPPIGVVPPIVIPSPSPTQH